MKKTHKLLAVVMWLGSAQANADTPRTLASGAPACGNTMVKKGPSLECRAELARAELEAIRHAEMLGAVALAHAARTREAAARRLAARTFAAALARH